LYGDDTRQTIDRIIDRQMHPNNALDNGDTVQILKDVHRGEVAANNTLDLCRAVVIILEGIASEPTAEGGLDLDYGPNGYFQIAFGEPAAYECLYSQHGTHPLNRHLPGQEPTSLGLDGYGRGP
jgi:hypothetical protein